MIESLKQHLPGLLGSSMSVPEQRQLSGCSTFAKQQVPGLVMSSIVPFVPSQRQCPTLFVSSKQHLIPYSGSFMYPESQAAMDEIKPALSEMSRVFEAIFCPYAPKLVKSYLINQMIA